jgi:D-serine deaminase-like pyridoxal phosphate-dependent protein
VAPDLDGFATPLVVVDLAVLERNISAMAEKSQLLGLALRPHAKTHKCVQIAARQLAAGAVGLTVATLGEAEVFADAGCEDLFIAYPLWVDTARAGRLAALAERVRLRVGVDSPDAAAALGRAVGRRRLEVLVEVDSGHHRSGVSPAEAGRVADAAARVGLVVVGAFTFPGHSYGVGAVEQAARDETEALAGASEAIRSSGHAVSVLSGGSTPTALLTGTGAVDEIRPGVYVFNDAQQVALGTCRLDDVALSVLATVTSTPEPGRFVLDSGSKVLGTDRPSWVPGHGMVVQMPHATLTRLAEHHAVVTTGDGWSAEPNRADVAVGQRLRVVPNHVCTCVNLVDELVLTNGDEVVDVWPVDARGRNS